jgi:signal transduction histidine kinase
VTLPASDVRPGTKAHLRPLSYVALLAVAAIAVAGFLVTRQVVHDQEKRLLKQRADEAGLYLSSAIGSVTGTLSSVSASAALSNDDRAKFIAANTPLTKVPTGFKSIALVRTTPTVAVVATAGNPIAALDSAAMSAVHQAAAKVGITGSVVSTQLFGPAGSRRLGFAYASPQTPGYAVYAESEVHPENPTPATAGQPFSELVVAVYAVPSIRADQLLVASAASSQLPLKGATEAVKVSVGQGPQWLMVTKARHPLVGSVATATPWALLAAGMLAAVLATAVVETLSRRREYALAVADARTRELKQSLEDLAAAHEQLVRQERLAAIGELASTIGHELRNPLGVISNALYLLRGDVAKAPTDASSRHLATAEREVSAATVIVSDLLEFARQREPVMTEVDTGAVVDEALGVLPPPTGITVERRPSVAPVTAVADRDMLRQVLLNLVGNAYQAMPDGGTVTVSVADIGDGAEVRVADTGIGMTKDVRTNLFEPFFTTKARGVGLGLAVSKRIIEAHSGTVTVDSEPGAGSTFTVTLPKVRVPRQVSATEDLTSESSGAVQ